MYSAVIRDERTGEVIAVIPLDPKTYRTGSKGWWGSRKVTISGERVQAQVQLVVIGSRAMSEGNTSGGDYGARGTF